MIYIGLDLYGYSWLLECWLRTHIVCSNQNLAALFILALIIMKIFDYGKLAGHYSERWAVYRLTVNSDLQWKTRGAT